MLASKPAGSGFLLDALAENPDYTFESFAGHPDGRASSIPLKRFSHQVTPPLPKDTRALAHTFASCLRNELSSMIYCAIGKTSTAVE
jgi:hypothetical protein